MANLHVQGRTYGNIPHMKKTIGSSLTDSCFKSRM